MSSLEEITVMRTEVIGGMHEFYRSLDGDNNPVQVVRRIQGKVTDLINYVQVLEEYVNSLPCTPRERDKPETAKVCPYLRSSENKVNLDG